MRDLLPCPPCGRQGRPGQGTWQARIHEPRGSAPRERDHRGGDHPVPSRTRQLSPPSPRVLQREAAGGQGVALAEGAFLCLRGSAREEMCGGAPHAPRRPAGGSPLRAFSRLGEVAASLAARSALRCIRPPPGIVGRAGTAGGSPPVGLSVFRGRSLPEDLREDFLLDRSCARHVLEDLRGLPAGLLALTWTSNLTEAARPALSRRSAVSKGLCLGCPPL